MGDMNAVKLLDFGMALVALKRGECVARRGWNGKRQYLSLGTEFSYLDNNGKWKDANHQTSGSSAIIFHGTIGVQVGWLASQSDMLSEDWEIVDPRAWENEPLERGDK